MKIRFIISFCVIVLGADNAFAQRYLKNVFTRVDSIPDIIYGNAFTYLHQPQALLLDFYQPYKDKVKKRPLLIYVHGGGWGGGTRKFKHIRMICEKMALKGYATASINYRYDPTFKIISNSTYDKIVPDTNRRAMTDAMHDLKAAIRFFKANHARYGIDTSNIIIGGESAGAVTSMMATYIDKQHELKAYPKTNPNTVEGNSGNAGHTSKPKAALCLCGTLIDTSAIETPKDPPFLWIHGSKDTMLPMEWAESVLTRAKKVGLPHKSYVFEGSNHCPWYVGNPDWENFLEKTVTYISGFLYPLVK